MMRIITPPYRLRSLIVNPLRIALTLGIGVVVSLLCAVTITRIFLSTIGSGGRGRFARFLFGSGLSK